MIELKNISKTFKTTNQEIHALRDVSLKIEEGKIFGIIGKSGAGKSTLIRCVNLLERPDTGEILIDGNNLLNLSNSRLTLERRKIGMIFQHFNLLSSRTIEENIAFPMELEGASKSSIKTKVDELLQLVGISEKAKEYPANLSGGQKQRVAIARALANNPTVLLCDEATSALDPATTKSILRLLKEINQRLNLTILLITHEMEVINTICDEVGIIEHGKLVEHGTVEEIFTNPKENITQEFIKNSLDIVLPLNFQKNILNDFSENSSPIYKVNFTNQPKFNQLIAEIKNVYQVEAEIINSRIEYAGDINYGTFFLKLNTTNQDTSSIEYYLQQNKFNLEKIGYVRNNH